MKIIFLDSQTLGNASLDSIAALGELVLYPSSSPQEAAERVKEADVLIVNKVLVGRELMERAPKLKLICVAATGVNNIDLEAAAERSIEVRNVAAYSSDSVAQLTWTQILNMSLDVKHFETRVSDGTYSSSGMFTDLSRDWNELSGKTLGIIGMGAIGQRVAAIGRAMGMDVVYFSTSGTKHCTDYRCLSLEEVLSVSDVVSIHAPLNERTKGLIGSRELALMRSTAFLVNAGRGGIVDEGALAKALDNGQIAAAAIDVFECEPLPIDSPLLQLSHPERLHLTPHIAWSSVEARKRLVQGIADNIKTFREAL